MKNALRKLARYTEPWANKYMIASSNLGRKLKLVLGAHSANEKFQWQETTGALKHKSTKIEKFSTKYVILSEYFM